MNILDFMNPRPFYATEGDGGSGDGGERDSALANPGGNEGDGGDKGGADDSQWRTDLAGDNADYAKTLERFKTPGAFIDSYAEAQNKIRSGNDRAPAPDGEKDPDGLKAWREEHGIPEAPDGYGLSEDLTKGFKDEDKPFVDAFLKHSHDNNLPLSSIEPAVQFYLEQQNAADVELGKQDDKFSEDTIDALRTEFGAEYKPNMEMAMRFASEVNEGIDWTEARLPDGRRLGSVPEFVKTLVEFGKQKYGDSSYAGVENTRVSDGRLAEIKKMQAEKGMAWWDQQTALKAEELDLIGRRDRRNAVTG